MKKALYGLLCIYLFGYSNTLLGQTQTKSSLNQNRDNLPYDRLLKPAGDIIVFGDSTKECHALDAALSPDNKWLAVEERYSIVFINTHTNKIGFTLPLDSIFAQPGVMSTYSGICWHNLNNTNNVFFSASSKNSASYICRLSWNGKGAKASRIFQYKAVAPAKLALPNELLIKKETGKDYLYVVLNGNNQLLKQDLLSGDTVWAKNTGVAPYSITCAKNKIYVTNRAGRIPERSDTNVAGVPWGLARINPSTAACREGSVSVFDPASGKLIKEIVVDPLPGKIIASPDGNFVYLTCSNSDEVSVINTNTDKISETVSLRLSAHNNHFSGDSPNSLALSPDGKTLYVANGMDNAIAVIGLSKNSCTGSGMGKSIVRGYIPVAAYPSSIQISNNNKMYVTNLESFGANKPFAWLGNHPPVYNSHHMLASVSVIPVPSKKQLAGYTKTVIAANQLERLKSTTLSPGKNAKIKPVPDRIGEPSAFKHVLYIIKENRTYDQVLGDLPKGNGDSSLCIFGKKVTPNTHKLLGDYVLMDNFFASGKCSAEGHSWTDASIVTDYIEKNVRAWFRSYPHVLYDALGYPSTGFIWDNAREHGKSVRIYGEAARPEFDDSLTWGNIYSNYMQGRPFEFTNTTTLNTVKEFLSLTYPGYDGHKIPDLLRADAFINELKKYVSMDGDSLPELMVMALPNDHTAGTSPGFPTPRAMVADNDLALGRIIEAVSHSRFWKNTVIFVVEDDSQDGWDHVSSYRTVAMVISAYSKKQDVVHIPYNQPSVVRTIEQILGLPPMNIQDAIALPMTGCFTETPDFSPYIAVSNETALDEMNPPLSLLSGKQLAYAKKSLEPQFDGIDTGNDDLLNHILWFASFGEDIPYPERFTGDDDD